MRVTNKLMYQQVLRQVQSRLEEMTRAQGQVATGRRHTRLSEDPVAGSQVLRSDRTLRAVVQYRRAVNAVRTHQATTEGVLDQVTDLLSRAKELATAQAGSSGNGASRAAAAAEVDQLFQQAIALGNSRIGNEFIFGGTATATPPFQADGSFVGTAASRQSEIEAGHVVEIVPSGQALFVDTSAIIALRDLRDRLATNDAAGVITSLGSLDGAFDGIQARLAEVGARTRTLDNTGTQLDAREDNATLDRSIASDISLEEASIQLMSAQTSLQAAIMAGTRLLGSNLLGLYQ